MKDLKHLLEKWSVKMLYHHHFTRFGRINKKRKKLIFDFACYGIFQAFFHPKERLAFSILCRWCGYSAWEIRPNFWCKPYVARIEHTWGEIQDIIRAYHTIPCPPLFKRVLPTDIDTEAPFLGSKSQHAEFQLCAMELVRSLVAHKKTFQDFFKLSDIGGMDITVEHLRPLIERECVTCHLDNTLFMVTPKFIEIISEFKKK